MGTYINSDVMLLQNFLCFDVTTVLVLYRVPCNLLWRQAVYEGVRNELLTLRCLLIVPARLTILETILAIF